MIDLFGELIINGDLVIEEDATFSWTGGHVYFNLEDNGDDHNVVMMDRSRILINEEDFTIAPFTHVRPSLAQGTEILLENSATGHFGQEAFLDVADAHFEMRDSRIIASPVRTVPWHKGLHLNGAHNEIIDSEIVGGIWGILYEPSLSPPARLIVEDSKIETSLVAIEARDVSLGIERSILEGNSHALWTHHCDGEVLGTTLGAGDIAWKATLEGQNLTVLGDVISGAAVGLDVLGEEDTQNNLTIDGTTFEYGGIGLFASGPVGIQMRDSVLQNLGLGVSLVGDVLLDMRFGAENHFDDYQEVAVMLQDAPFPLLYDGENHFDADPSTETFRGTAADEGTCLGGVALTDASTNYWYDSGGVVRDLGCSEYSVANAGGCDQLVVPPAEEDLSAVCGGGSIPIPFPFP